MILYRDMETEFSPDNVAFEKNVQNQQMIVLKVQKIIYKFCTFFNSLGKRYKKMRNFLKYLAKIA